MSSLIYHAEKLLEILPHRHPFVLLDRVEVEEPGVKGIGFSYVSISNPVFAGHFPGRPIYPGVLLIETAAQAAGVIAMAANERPPSVALLATVRKFAFRKPVLPGEQVQVQCRRRARIGDLNEFECIVCVDGERRAEGAIAVAVGADAKPE